MEFEVSDTGIGIAADELPMIFEKFSRADSSESANYSGAGLGLYIVKRVVHLLEGNIDVQSKVGRGSTVHPHSRAATESATDAGAIGFCDGTGRFWNRVA